MIPVQVEKKKFSDASFLQVVFMTDQITRREGGATINDSSAFLARRPHSTRNSADMTPWTMPRAVRTASRLGTLFETI